MLKIRHIISLLVLILLFISCNLKSPQRGGMIRKDPDFRRIVAGDGALRKPIEAVTLTGVEDPDFKKIGTGDGDLKKPIEVAPLRGVEDPDFKKIGTGDGDLKKPIEVAPLRGVEDPDFKKIGTGDGDLKKPIEVAPLRGVEDPDFKKIVAGDGDLKKPIEVVTFTGIEDLALTEVEKNLGVKLNELLDTFGVPEEGKRSIVKIKDIVTNDKIGIDRFGVKRLSKTYTNIGFYNLLNKLGPDEVQKIIKYDLYVVEAQKAALESINDIQEPKEKQRFKVSYDDVLNDYLLCLKGLFSDIIDDIERNGFISNEYTNEYTHEFTETEFVFRRIIKRENLYERSSYK
ncbi:hypothetical protein BOFE_09410 (plasmid) [Candidatus Borrelia fainii]|uniref:Uncharacterized protein n=1 Tax=Candidatus Borrelia fainii TaxID=2518322 RepID=A0ABM8DLC9_9SPIR|nr:hypothetical protein [Candidatus Borrelia fainii]BDU63401.1 hypothetical protein BOFE_09410 [Candidatus Borrelia fainii]